MRVLGGSRIHMEDVERWIPLKTNWRNDKLNVAEVREVAGMSKGQESNSNRMPSLYWYLSRIIMGSSGLTKRTQHIDK